MSLNILYWSFYRLSKYTKPHSKRYHHINIDKILSNIKKHNTNDIVYLKPAVTSIHIFLDSASVCSAIGRTFFLKIGI